MYGYPVNLQPDDNDTAFVTFSDVPEAVTFGDDEEDALLHAVDALMSVLAQRDQGDARTAVGRAWPLG